MQTDRFEFCMKRASAEKVSFASGTDAVTRRKSAYLALRLHIESRHSKGFRLSLTISDVRHLRKTHRCAGRHHAFSLSTKIACAFAAGACSVRLPYEPCAKLSLSPVPRARLRYGADYLAIRRDPIALWRARRFNDLGGPLQIVGLRLRRITVS